MNDDTRAELQRLWDEVEQAIPVPPHPGDPLSNYNKGGRAMGRWVLALLDKALDQE